MENSYKLDKETNETLFKYVILPELKNRYFFKKSKKPTVKFLITIPGLRKSKFLKEYQPLPIVSINKLRMFHPYIEEIYKNESKNIEPLTELDCLQWYMQLKQELYNIKADFVIDFELKNKEEAIFDIEEALMHNYNIEITIVAIQEYEALMLINRFYAEIYKKDPYKANYIEPNIVKQSTNELLSFVEKIEKLPIDKLQIVTFNGKIIYNRCDYENRNKLSFN